MKEDAFELIGELTAELQDYISLLEISACDDHFGRDIEKLYELFDKANEYFKKEK